MNLDSTKNLLGVTEKDLSVDIKAKRARDVTQMMRTDGWLWLDSFISKRIEFLSDIRNIKDEESQRMVTAIRQRQTEISTLRGVQGVLSIWVKQAERSEKKYSKGDNKNA